MDMRTRWLALVAVFAVILAGSTPAAAAPPGGGSGNDRIDCLLDAVGDLWLSRSTLITGQSVVVNWKVTLPSGCTGQKSIVGVGFSGTVPASGSRTLTPNLGTSTWRLHLQVALAGGIDLDTVSANVIPVPRRPMLSALRDTRDNRLELFYTDPNDAVHLRPQDSPGAGSHSSIVLDSVLQRSIATSVDRFGNVDLFGLNGEGRLFRRIQLQPHSNTWDNWIEIAPFAQVTSIAAARNAAGFMELFGTTLDGVIMHRSEDNFGFFTNWEPFDPPAIGLNNVAAITNHDGLIEVFAYTGTGTTMHRWQLAGGGWSPWGTFGTDLNSICLTLMPNGALLLAGIEWDNTVWAIAETVPGSHSWGGWSGLGTVNGGQVTAATNANGVVEVINVDATGTIRHIGWDPILDLWLFWRPWEQPAI